MAGNPVHVDYDEWSRASIADTVRSKNNEQPNFCFQPEFVWPKRRQAIPPTLFVMHAIICDTVSSGKTVEHPMRTILSAVRAVAFAIVFLLLCLWVAAMRLRSLDCYLGARLPECAASLGILFILIGDSLALTCLTLFIVQGRGTPAPFDAPRKFVALGPYRVVGNPMYIGGLTLLFGFGLYQHSKAILLFCPLCFFFAHVFVIFYEEPTLMSKFGTAYHGYIRAVPRWIPRS